MMQKSMVPNLVPEPLVSKSSPTMPVYKIHHSAKPTVPLCVPYLGAKQQNPNPWLKASSPAQSRPAGCFAAPMAASAATNVSPFSAQEPDSYVGETQQRTPLYSSRFSTQFPAPYPAALVEETSGLYSSPFTSNPPQSQLRPAGLASRRPAPPEKKIRLV
jgi:hypothetical protein